MFDPFSVSHEYVDHVHLESCINSSAVLFLLIEKGIATEEEFLKMRLKVQPMVEQTFQKKREEQQKQFEEDHPSAGLFKKMFGGEE